jgi:phosphate transport system permease protein
MTQISDKPVSEALQYSVAPSRKLFGNVMTGLVFLCVIITILPLGSILFTVIKNGIGSLSPAVFTELPPAAGVSGGGFRNAIVGTLLTCLIGAMISVPFGVLTAIYTVEFGNDNRLSSFVRFCTNVLSGVPLIGGLISGLIRLIFRFPLSQFVRFCTNVLSGVPSIIAGLFAYGVVVLTTGKFSAIAGGVALSVLMLPIIIRTTEEGLKSVPRDTRLAATGLGATNFQSVSQIILPAALPFVATGITLSLARAAGETAPLLFTALFNQYDNKGVWEPTATLSVLIYNFAISPYKNQQALAWAASLIIVLLILVVSIVARMIARRKVY